MKQRPIIMSAESVQAILDGRKTQIRRVVRPQPFEIDSFGNPLWDKLNAKRGYSWESNPFVWVIEFRRLEE